MGFLRDFGSDAGDYERANWTGSCCYQMVHGRLGALSPALSGRKNNIASLYPYGNGSHTIASWPFQPSVSLQKQSMSTWH